MTIFLSDRNKKYKGCGEVKALGEFYRHFDMKDGHLNSCKECRKAYQRSRPYDKERERKRNQTEKRKAYHAANLKRWRRENPQKMAVQLARRRARKLHAEGDFTVEEFEALCEKYGNVCLRCGDGDALLTPDHIVPLSLGGSNLISNIQTAPLRQLQLVEEHQSAGLPSRHDPVEDALIWTAAPKGPRPNTTAPFGRGGSGSSRKTASEGFGTTSARGPEKRSGNKRNKKSFGRHMRYQNGPRVHDIVRFCRPSGPDP